MSVLVSLCFVDVITLSLQTNTSQSTIHTVERQGGLELFLWAELITL